MAWIVLIVVILFFIWLRAVKVSTRVKLARVDRQLAELKNIINRMNDQLDRQQEYIHGQRGDDMQLALMTANISDKKLCVNNHRVRVEALSRLADELRATTHTGGNFNYGSSDIVDNIQYHLGVTERQLRDIIYI